MEFKKYLNIYSSCTYVCGKYSGKCAEYNDHPKTDDDDDGEYTNFSFTFKLMEKSVSVSCLPAPTVNRKVKITTD